MTLRTAGAVLLMAATAAALTSDALLTEYQERRTRMQSELAGAHYVLGTWCAGEKLSGEAREHLKEALELQPGHAAAQRALAKLSRQVAGAGAKCELRLRSGERPSAQLRMDVLCVKTDSGILFIPVARVDLIKLRSGAGADLVVADGFHGEARIADEKFVLGGKIGSVEGTRRTLAGIRVFHPCPVCQGRIKWKCPACEGAGRIVKKKVCPKCKGKGKVKCKTCRGRALIRCPDCLGKGFNWGTYDGLRARYHCSRCKRTGKLPCPDCQGGGVECPDCLGEPVETTESVCPQCKGKKILRCTACEGTGVKPLPPNAEKEEKRPAKTP